MWIVQVGLVLWLLWWMLPAASPFNHYWDGDSSTLIFDCDRNTELAAAFAMSMIWLTTFVIVGVSVWLKFWRRFQMLWGINALSLFLSRWIESFVERAYGDKTLSSVGFRSSTATYVICNLITPAYLSLMSLVRFYELLVYGQALPQSCP
ncbi:MAG: hypothetical protein AAF622_13865 [Cyanobacteria bacterium P01_C01_bin.147]